MKRQILSLKAILYFLVISQLAQAENAFNASEWRKKSANAIFEINDSSTYEEFRSSYRKLFQQYHPDRTAEPYKAEAQEIFIIIKESREQVEKEFQSGQRPKLTSVGNQSNSNPTSSRSGLWSSAVQPNLSTFLNDLKSRTNGLFQEVAKARSTTQRSTSTSSLSSEPSLARSEFSDFIAEIDVEYFLSVWTSPMSQLFGDQSSLISKEVIEIADILYSVEPENLAEAFMQADKSLDIIRAVPNGATLDALYKHLLKSEDIKIEALALSIQYRLKHSTTFFQNEKTFTAVFLLGLRAIDAQITQGTREKLLQALEKMVEKSPRGLTAEQKNRATQKLNEASIKYGLKSAQSATVRSVISACSRLFKSTAESK